METVAVTRTGAKSTIAGWIGRHPGILVLIIAVGLGLLLPSAVGMLHAQGLPGNLGSPVDLFGRGVPLIDLLLLATVLVLCVVILWARVSISRYLTAATQRLFAKAEDDDRRRTEARATLDMPTLASGIANSLLNLAMLLVLQSIMRAPLVGVGEVYAPKEWVDGGFVILVFFAALLVLLGLHRVSRPLIEHLVWSGLDQVMPTAGFAGRTLPPTPPARTVAPTSRPPLVAPSPVEATVAAGALPAAAATVLASPAISAMSAEETVMAPAASSPMAAEATVFAPAAEPVVPADVTIAAPSTVAAPSEARAVAAEATIVAPMEQTLVADVAPPVTTPPAALETIVPPAAPLASVEATLPEEPALAQPTTPVAAPATASETDVTFAVGPPEPVPPPEVPVQVPSPPELLPAAVPPVVQEWTPAPAAAPAFAEATVWSEPAPAADVQPAPPPEAVEPLAPAPVVRPVVGLPDEVAPAVDVTMAPGEDVECAPEPAAPAALGESKAGGEPEVTRSPISIDEPPAAPEVQPIGIAATEEAATAEPPVKPGEPAQPAVAAVPTPEAQVVVEPSVEIPPAPPAPGPNQGPALSSPPRPSIQWSTRRFGPAPTTHQQPPQPAPASHPAAEPPPTTPAEPKQPGGGARVRWSEMTFVRDAHAETGPAQPEAGEAPAKEDQTIVAGEEQSEDPAGGSADRG